MALYIKYRGHSNTLAELTAAAFTQDNYDATNVQLVNNTTLSADTPKGLLGGSVVMMLAGSPYTITAFDGSNASNVPVGILINDVAMAAYENTPAVASNKGPYMHCMGAYEVDVYETVTRTEDGATPISEITYTEGDWLYGSANGLLTNEDPTGGTTGVKIGVVTKAPSATDGRLGFNLLI